MNREITDKPRLTTDPRVSGYDKLSAFLTASVTVFGLLVFLMFMMWLTTIVEWGSTSMPSVIQELAGNGNRPEGIADDWQPPGVEEFPEVDTPQLADSLEATTDAISSVRASLESVDGDAPEMGRGTGLGDKRARGPGNGNGNIIPEADRWKIELVASTQGEYMKILESFDITLGVVHELSNLIEYVDDLTASVGSVSENERKNESRLFFMNKKNRLRRWDQNKAESVGLELKNTLVGHFYPPALREQMLALEYEVYSKAGKTLEEVRLTEFRIRPAGSGYEYFIPQNGIQYRPKPVRPSA